MGDMAPLCKGKAKLDLCAPSPPYFHTKENTMASIAIYPGSFDPFTCGHMDIVKKAARLFSHLYVVIGVNTDKARTYDASRMRDAIARTVADAGIENCTVCRPIRLPFTGSPSAIVSPVFSI